MWLQDAKSLSLSFCHVWLLTWVILSTETGMPSMVRGGNSELTSWGAGACSASADSRSSRIMLLYLRTCGESLSSGKQGKEHQERWGQGCRASHLPQGAAEQKKQTMPQLARKNTHWPRRLGCIEELMMKHQVTLARGIIYGINRKVLRQDLWSGSAPFTLWSAIRCKHWQPSWVQTHHHYLMFGSRGVRWGWEITTSDF